MCLALLSKKPARCLSSGSLEAGERGGKKKPCKWNEMAAFVSDPGSKWPQCDEW